MLSLLDILFPDATLKVVKQLSHYELFSTKTQSIRHQRNLQRVDRLDNLERSTLD